MNYTIFSYSEAEGKGGGHGRRCVPPGKSCRRKVVGGIVAEGYGYIYAQGKLSRNLARIDFGLNLNFIVFTI